MSAAMRTVILRGLTGPGSLALEHAPIPQPGPDQVRLRMAAAGLNRSDLQMTTGDYHGPGFALPQPMGQEGAGIVDAVGDGVVSVAPGDRVIGRVRGALADYGIAAAGDLVRLPEAISLQNGAALPIAHMTAGIALICQARVRSGEWVLVQGASGGVGVAAVQLARLLGARVIATAGSEAKRARLRALGVDVAVGYDDVVEAVAQHTDGAGVDVGLDGAGAATFTLLLQSLAEHGRACLYGTVSGMPTGGAETIFRRNATLFGLVLWTSRHYPAGLELLRETVLPAVAAGRLSPCAEVVSRDALHEALGRLERRDHFGKLVVATDG